MTRVLLIAGWWLALFFVADAETLPPPPARYFNDAAGIVPPATAQKLDDELRQFERETSNQIVVAIFPKMESASSIQDFTHRIAESWKVGQKERNNGAVLFVFTEERSMFIQVGYGLEGALPDITCKQIIENEIVPAFKTGDFAAGLSAGVAAMMKATRGEYRAPPEAEVNSGAILLPLFFLALFAVLIVSQVLTSYRKAVVYSRKGRSFAGTFLLDFLAGVLASGGGSSRGSSSRGGGGGGSSGGGGSFGGGGAGGRW